jgi:hypothetical protein
VNFRRGLFRLWIVGSALWVLAVAFLSYPVIKAQFETVESAATLKPVSEKPVSEKPVSEKPVSEKPVSDPEVIKRLPPGTLTPVTDPELIKRLEGKTTPDHWATLGEWAAIALGVPLAALALGSSLLWALSGFAVTRQP